MRGEAEEHTHGVHRLKSRHLILDKARLRNLGVKYYLIEVIPVEVLVHHDLRDSILTYNSRHIANNIDASLIYAVLATFIKRYI